MYDILYNDPALFEITIVLLILVAIAIWQKLYRTASVMCAVFIFYLIFVILTSESVQEIVKTETNDIHDEIVKNEKVDKITIQEISDSTIKETKNYEPDLKAKIPACITTTKQRPARSIVVEVSMESIITLYILNLNHQKWGYLQNPVMD